MVERSLSMRPGSWQVVEDATLERIGDLFRFTTARQVVHGEYYRVVIKRPPILFVEDFEANPGDWTSATSAGSTQWELGETGSVGIDHRS